MSPHGKLRERGIFLADLDRERAERQPGEPPTLRKALALEPIGARHPTFGARSWPTVADHG